MSNKGAVVIDANVLVAIATEETGRDQRALKLLNKF